MARKPRGIGEHGRVLFLAQSLSDFCTQVTSCTMLHCIRVTANWRKPEAVLVWDLRISDSTEKFLPNRHMSQNRSQCRHWLSDPRDGKTKHGNRTFKEFVIDTRNPVLFLRGMQSGPFSRKRRPKDASDFKPSVDLPRICGARDFTRISRQLSCGRRGSRWRSYPKPCAKRNMGGGAERLGLLELERR